MHQKSIAITATLLIAVAANVQAQSADSPLAALIAKRGQETAKNTAEKSPPVKAPTQTQPPPAIPTVKTPSSSDKVAPPSTEKAQTTTSSTQPSVSKIESQTKAAGTNPVTGQDATVEELDKILQIKKRQTEIALEDAKRLKAESDAALLGGGKKQDQKIAAAQADLKRQSPDNETNTPKGKKGGKNKVEAIVMQPPQPMGPNLVGVMMSKGESIAIIDLGGQTIYLKKGESAGGFTVNSVGQNSAEISGRTYQVAQSPSRQVSVDRQAAAPGSQVSSVGGASSMRIPPNAGPMAQGPLPPINSISTSAQSVTPVTVTNSAGNALPPAPPPPPVPQN